MTDAFDVLEKEHEVLERLIAVVNELIVRLETDGVIPANCFAGVAHFMAGYTDDCHLAKEEGILFAKLRKKGITVKGGPIGQLLGEHREVKNYVLAAKIAAEAVGSGAAGAKPDLTEALRSLSAVLSQHIFKENQVFYPLAREVLSPEEHRLLGEEFAQAMDGETGRAGMLSLLADMERSLFGSTPC